MISVPLIGIMVSRKKQRRRILKLYHSRWRKDLETQLCTFTPGDVCEQTQTVTGIIKAKRGLKEKVLAPPNAVYNRCYNRSTKIFDSLDKMIGKKYFNAITHLNKWVVYTLLKESDVGIYLPETFLYDGSMIIDRLEEWKLLYLKPVHGNKGRKVNRLELTENGEVLVSSHSLAPRHILEKNEDIRQKLKGILGRRKFIMQEGIPSQRTEQSLFDLRVLVQKNIKGTWTVSAVVSRVAYEGFFNTGIFQQIYDAEFFLPQLIGEDSGVRLLEDLRTISIHAAQLLDGHLGLLGELSVDFILDEDDRPWIIEVNGCPQKSIYRGIEDFHHIEPVYRRPLEYAYYLSQLSPDRLM